MSTIRVVVVDDEPLARRRIVRLLADREGFEVAGEFGSGRKAALAIPEIEPDLLFLDVQMPEMGGFEVLESLYRSRPPGVILVTAKDDDPVRGLTLQSPVARDAAHNDEVVIDHRRTNPAIRKGQPPVILRHRVPQSRSPSPVKPTNLPAVVST